MSREAPSLIKLFIAKNGLADLGPTLNEYLEKKLTEDSFPYELEDVK